MPFQNRRKVSRLLKFEKNVKNIFSNAGHVESPWKRNNSLKRRIACKPDSAVSATDSCSIRNQRVIPLSREKKIPDFSRQNCRQYVEQMHMHILIYKFSVNITYEN